jgi:mRNA turnover protein 4
MPKSRRAKIVPLTVTKAKGREHKGTLIDKIRDAVKEYDSIYTFRVENIRTNILQQVREERRDDSRLFMGNNKVMMLALGKDEETTHTPNLFKLSTYLTGLSGLLATNMPKKEVKEYFSGIEGEVYARTGSVSTVDFTLPPAALPQFPHSMYDQLSKLGLPIKLDKGTIVVTAETVVCQKGDVLTAEAAQILKLFNMQTADFKLELTAHWTNGTAKKVSN